MATKHSIADDGIAKALKELEAEQYAWRENQRREAEARRALSQREQRQRLRAIRWVEKYLVRQEHRLANFWR